VVRRGLLAAAALVAVRLAHADTSAGPADWRRATDLDGDGKPDEILVESSGGAHCCYTIAARLTSTRATVRVPFEIDGGYVGGLDLSRPEHFALHRASDGAAELLFDAEGPPARRRVAVRFTGGKLTVRDAPPRCDTEAALRAHDGATVEAIGVYQKRPIQRKMRPGSPLEDFGHAQLALDGGFSVALGKGPRPPDERARLDGKRVRVTGRFVARPPLEQPAHVAQPLPPPTLFDPVITEESP